MNDKVALLLSTYNGEKYLRELLDSIIEQSYSSYVLFIRDDGSSDNTPAIVNEYVDNYENIVFINKGEEKNIGVINSFSTLLNVVLAEEKAFRYFMFVDQDDIWLKNKIELTLNEFKLLELSSLHMPLLVHTNLQVVNERLEVIEDSFWHYQKINPSRCSINQISLQNVATGCTMMVNRALVKKALPIPSHAIMHDWWFAMVASCFGKISWIEEPMIKYRQHEKNTVGAKKFHFIPLLKKIREKGLIGKTMEQARAFLECFNKELSQQDKKALHAFIELEKLNRFQRLKSMFINKFFKSGLARNLGLIYILLTRKKL